MCFWFSNEKLTVRGAKIVVFHFCKCNYFVIENTKIK